MKMNKVFLSIFVVLSISIAFINAKSLHEDGHRRSKRNVTDSNDGDISFLGNIIETGKAVPGKALKLMTNTMDKLDGALEELDARIKALQNATKQIELKNIEMTREFLDNYFVVKEDLRNARFDLRKLARKTVIMTDDIKGLLEIWDGKSNFEIQEQFATLKQFLTDAVPIFKSSEEKYKNAITSLSNSQATFDLFKVGIKNMNTKGTTEHDTWTKTVRASVYGTTSAGTIGCIFADIFATFGACSAIYNSIAWPSTLAGVELAIAAYEEELERMINTSESILTNISELDGTMDEAIDFLTVELNIIIDWQANSDSVRARVSRLSPEKLKKIENIFARGLDELKASAQNFLERPDKIFEDF